MMIDFSMHSKEHQPMADGSCSQSKEEEYPRKEPTDPHGPYNIIETNIDIRQGGGQGSESLK